MRRASSKTDSGEAVEGASVERTLKSRPVRNKRKCDLYFTEPGAKRRQSALIFVAKDKGIFLNFMR